MKMLFLLQYRWGMFTMAYDTRQWAAVTTQYWLIREPPQKWNPEPSCKGEDARMQSFIKQKVCKLSRKSVKGELMAT